MKKRAIGILCMLLCVCFLSASAQETQVDEFFRCQVGQISFVLPGYPQIFHLSSTQVHSCFGSASHDPPCERFSHDGQTRGLRQPWD